MSDRMSPTPAQIEAYCQKLITELKQDPKWELKQEFGRMLLTHIDDFTDQERERYIELQRLINE